MNNLISFCLWGNEKKYTNGALNNAILVKELFTSEWKMKLYYNDTVDESLLNDLKKEGVILSKVNKDESFKNMMWRFLPAEDASIDYFISRDLDSVLCERDLCVIEDWIESGKDFSIVRDHPWQGEVISGGMWGCKGGKVPHISELIEEYCKTKKQNHNRLLDLMFLKEIIYEKYAKNSYILHDEFFNWEGTAVKIKRDRKIDNYQFIGEALNEHGVQRSLQREELKKYFGVE
jgi:hypothetical protein